MARVLVLALCCAVRAEHYDALPYGDYWPAPPDDYRAAHLASAPVHYKDAEDAHGDADERDVGPERRQRSDEHQTPLRGSLGDELEREDLEPEVPPEPATSRRHSRHRERGRKASRRDGGASPRRRGSDRGRRRPAHDRYHSDEDYRGEGDERGTPGSTTERIIRRKPRDRYFPEDAPRSVGIEDDDDKILNRQSRPDEWPEMEWERPEAAGGLVPSPGPPPPPRRDSDVDRDTDRALDTDRRHKLSKYRNYPDSGEYYDMKRVNAIKGNIPSLLHRTTAPAGLRRSIELGPERRAGDEPPPPASSAAPASESTTVVSVVTQPPELVVPLTSPAPPPSPSSELSVAERSRLSILRKAQMKEGAKGSSPHKPPVLLQQLRRAPTVVMVEPTSAPDPWRPVADDSPETLDKVKQLMRTKLVARADNIRDLTDDWDKLVCDYIDTSLLQAHAPPTPPHLSLAPAALLALLLLLAR